MRISFCFSLSTIQKVYNLIIHQGFLFTPLFYCWKKDYFKKHAFPTECWLGFPDPRGVPKFRLIYKGKPKTNFPLVLNLSNFVIPNTIPYTFGKNQGKKNGTFRREENKKSLPLSPFYLSGVLKLIDKFIKFKIYITYLIVRSKISITL